VRRALRRSTPSRGVLRCRLDVLTTSRAAYEKKHHSQVLNTQNTTQTHEKIPSSTRNPARVLRVLRARSKHTSPSPHASAARPAPQLTHSRYYSTPHGSPQALILVIVNLNVRKNKTNHQSVDSLSRAQRFAYTIITQLYRIAPLTWLTTHRTITRIRLVFIHRARTPAYDRPSRAHVAYRHTDVQRLSVSQVPPIASRVVSLPLYAIASRSNTYVVDQHTHTLHTTHTRARNRGRCSSSSCVRVCGAPSPAPARSEAETTFFWFPWHGLTNQDQGKSPNSGGYVRRV